MGCRIYEDKPTTDPKKPRTAMRHLHWPSLQAFEHWPLSSGIWRTCYSSARVYVRVQGLGFA